VTAQQQPAGKLIILSAPSGAGKTTLAHALAERMAAQGLRMAFSVSYTTRAPRPGEREGVDYHFVDDARFASMVDEGDFLEHAGVFGRSYGTGRAATERMLAANDWLILDIDWQGAQQVRERWPQVLSIFIEPPSLDELRNRLQRRGQDDATTIEARMAQAEAEMSHADEYDLRIVNDDLNIALDALEQAIKQAAKLR